ncbi:MULTISPECIES: HypC/HybG/HupF family hydrogenase formation chaperone [unclassified Mesorhizobium]|uniref:HypC/HybG/HupF family hydrogenase formation chaperone n=1 Tax=unclassified Mesorhizobium TaxID=325217 RepID=UPI0024167A1F|nr:MULTISPECIES: HypC/HybG/HupF family hydrogenase formation chaperone [unclassified Mesorhizobium]MDG4882800.1 HypC/HybG/HupF family hydrogenase formation chaperone [Mesorhizobium sp. WSM4884]WFP62886.1 HypC/HybG/HupF family hydrogenase formation chaperone [Mesorhizobium sp. WSM4904]WFP76158.1 HypC/HybG/HupF family hydrogenase formation chaperone [Mesorhizobium sp. WSM4906]
MCVGVPLEVLESRDGSALCRGRSGLRRIDMTLTGDQPAGTWIITFLDAAREVIAPEAARRIADALEAAERALAGETDLDHLFADLAGREPQLPEHLRAALPTQSTKDA